MLEKIILVLIALILTVLNSCLVFAQEITIFENVNVIPMTSDTLLTSQRVFVEGDIIKSVESMKEEFVAPDSALVIDGAGKYLIPGLSELHYHWRNQERSIETELMMMAVHGVTTVRNMAEYDWQDQIKIRDEIIPEMDIQLNYYTTGKYLKASDLSSKQAIDLVIKAHVEKDYDFLKIADNLSEELFLYLLDQCEAANLQVVGHAQRELPLEFSLRQKSIAHVEEFVYLFSPEQRNDEAFLESSVRQIKQSGVFVSPTLVVFEMITQFLNDDEFELLKSSEIREFMLEGDADYWFSDQNEYRANLLTREVEGELAPIKLKEWLEWMKMYTGLLAEAGVPLISGSDTFGVVVPGFSIHRELELLVESGLTPFQALQTSTSTSAIFLGVEDEEGSIEKAKQANLVLLDENPLQAISNTQTINGVMVKGKWIDHQTRTEFLNNLKRD